LVVSSPPPESHAEVRPTAVTASWMFCTTAPIEARRMRSLLARYSSAHSSEVATGKAFFQRASASTMKIATVFAM
jgi:hypothetical protein